MKIEKLYIYICVYNTLIIIFNMKTRDSQKYGLAGFLQFHEIQKSRHKNLLIFKTNIKTQKKVNAVKSIFFNHPTITGWSIDTNDIDNVLRIETAGQLEENDIIECIKSFGFSCEVLTN